MWSIHKAALFPSRVRICGVALDPMTVGHYAILEMLESPFLFGGKATDGDLLGTVALLSVAPSRAKLIVRYPVLMGIRETAIAWRMRRKRLAAETEIRRLAKWIAECVWFPERFREPGEKAAGPSSVPHSMKLIWLLTEHFTESEVLGMSIIKAHCLALARAEINGNQYETKGEYLQQWLPEDYAYHREAYPEITNAIAAMNAAGAEAGAARSEKNVDKLNAANLKLQAAQLAYQTACVEAGGGPNNEN